MAGLAVAALAGAAIAIAVMALFGRQLLGVPAPDTARVAAAETKLDLVGRDVVALRERLGQTAQAADTSAIAARLSELGGTIEASGGRTAALEGEIRTLSERLAVPVADPAVVTGLVARAEGLEARIAAAPKADAVAALGGRIDQMGTRLDGRIDQLGTRLDGVAAVVDDAVKPLAGQIQALDAAFRARPTGDPAARLAVALGALDQALTAGRPFATELGVARAAAADGAALAALEPLAAAGAPTRAALGVQLAALMAGLPPLGVAPTASVFDRFVANAGSLVTVTPKESPTNDAPTGGAPADVRARVAALAAKGDVEGALAGRNALDEAAKAATGAWAQAAEARLAAEKTLADARAGALARLGSTD